MKVGDILVSYWGYDQTNVDFYEVVKATPATVTVRQLNTLKAADDGGGTVAPVKGSYCGDPIRRKVQTYYGEEKIKLKDYAYARLWDGKPADYTDYD